MVYLRAMPVKNGSELPAIPVDERAAEVRAIKVGQSDSENLWIHALAESDFGPISLLQYSAQRGRAAAGIFVTWQRPGGRYG